MTSSIHSPIHLSIHTGEMTVLGGAQIQTGIAIEDYYCMIAAFGAGLDYCVGGGLMLHTGTNLHEFQGPAFMVCIDRWMDR